MAVASNAEVWASTRIGIFFPGSAPNLDGQCVCIPKYFLGEMCDIPNWSASRGDAKDFGDTLVRQGLADRVPEPNRGDIVVWKLDGGGYGHIGVMLDANRVFEQNVGVAGSISRIIEVKNSAGTVIERFPVYASRIDPLNAKWRKGPPTFYRVRSYVENLNKENGLMIIQNSENWYRRCNKTHLQIRGRALDWNTFLSFVGIEFLTFVEACSDNPEADIAQQYQTIGEVAVGNDWQGRLDSLTAQVTDLSTRPTKAQLEEVIAKAEQLQAQAAAAAEAASQLPVVNVPVIVPIETPTHTSPEQAVKPIQPATPSEAVKSATLFVARIGSQVAAARVIAEGIAVSVNQQLVATISQTTVGWMTIIIAAVLIFWAQFGYQLAQSAGWKWAANLKWPF